MVGLGRHLIHCRAQLKCKETAAAAAPAAATAATASAVVRGVTIAAMSAVAGTEAVKECVLRRGCGNTNLKPLDVADVFGNLPNCLLKIKYKISEA